jgi:hypothetical protein
LVGKYEGKRPLEIPRRRWEDDIKINLKGIWLGLWTGFVWLRIGTDGGAVVNEAMNLRVP